MNSNNGLSQIIKEATRVTKDSSTLIDHIYVSEPWDMCKSGVIRMGISDHHLINAVRGKIKCGTNCHVNIKFRSFRNLDEDQFHKDLRAVEWNEIKKLSDVNQMWNDFMTKFFKVVDNHLPFKERRINVNSEEWITDEILNEIHNREYLHERALRSKLADDWKLYKASRNRVTLKIREAKRDFVEGAIDQCNNRPKDMWSRIKQFLPSKRNSTLCSQLQTESGTITSFESMANCFNDFFCSIGHEIGRQFDSSLPDVEQLKPPGSFKIPEITIQFIANEIIKMAASKATGIDGLSVKLLKLSFNHIGDILNFIFNESISSCKFVDAWKRARVVPLYKAGDEHLVNNYRPVSILPVISKIIERHVFNSCYEYLSMNNLINKSQSGFRPSHSCETALNCLTDKWFKNMDDGKLTGVLFIDLRKAFDTVNYNVLLHKLASFGICQNTFN